MISFIDPAHVVSVWPDASKELNRAFEQTEDCAANHLLNLTSDIEQLWFINGQAWALTRVILGKSGALVLDIVAMGGQGLDQWGSEFFDTVEGWAKAQGCTKSIFTGRMGWLKRAHGYKPKRITFCKEL
jgi:hypothetical protein